MGSYNFRNSAVTMKKLQVLGDEGSRAYVKSLPVKQARHIEWRRTQSTPCPVLSWCTECHQFLPVTNFYALTGYNAHGRKTILREKRKTTCAACDVRRYQESDCATKMFYAAKRRAKMKDIKFDITIDDITIPEFCPILGLKLQSVRGTTGRDSSPSLDRIDNSKGYIKGNIAVISFRANTLKNNATADELRAVADFMDRFTG